MKNGVRVTLQIFSAEFGFGLGELKSQEHFCCILGFVTNLTGGMISDMKTVYPFPFFSWK